MFSELFPSVRSAVRVISEKEDCRLPDEIRQAALTIGIRPDPRNLDFQRVKNEKLYIAALACAFMALDRKNPCEVRSERFKRQLQSQLNMTIEQADAAICIGNWMVGKVQISNSFLRNSARRLRNQTRNNAGETLLALVFNTLSGREGYLSRAEVSALETVRRTLRVA